MWPQIRQGIVSGFLAAFYIKPIKNKFWSNSISVTYIITEFCTCRDNPFTVSHGNPEAISCYDLKRQQNKSFPEFALQHKNNHRHEPLFDIQLLHNQRAEFKKKINVSFGVFLCFVTEDKCPAQVPNKVSCSLRTLWNFSLTSVSDVYNCLESGGVCVTL